MSVLGAGLAVGGKFAGGGLAIYALTRFVMAFLEWCGQRWDAHCKRVVEREALADVSISNRLHHLEASEGRLLRQVAELTRAMSMLANKVREQDPFDETLVEVAQIVASCFGPPDKLVPADMAETIGRAQ